MACNLLPPVESRISELRDQFLSAQLAAEKEDPAGFTPDTNNLAAFRLLVHAEIEEYLEAKAREGLAAISAAFSSNPDGAKIRGNLNVLVIAQIIEKQLRFDAINWKNDVQSTLKSAEEMIRKNNGIKEASFHLLSVLSGKMPDEIDSALASSLSAYGTARGEVAHKSVARVTTIRPPSDEAKAASDLILQLDKYFDS